MDPKKLHDRVQAIFRNVFDDPKLIIKDETAAKHIRDWDSLAQINLVAGAEEAFKVRFQTAEIRSLKNVGEFKQLISRKLSKAK